MKQVHLWLLSLIAAVIDCTYIYTAVQKFEDNHKMYYFYVFFSNPVENMVLVLKPIEILTDRSILKITLGRSMVIFGH